MGPAPARYDQGLPVGSPALGAAAALGGYGAAFYLAAASALACAAISTNFIRDPVPRGRQAAVP
jgi:hypothetical protein